MLSYQHKLNAAKAARTMSWAEIGEGIERNAEEARSHLGFLANAGRNAQYMQAQTALQFYKTVFAYKCKLKERGSDLLTNAQIIAA